MARKQPRMHPRSIYHRNHDFKELAMEFPDFKANTTIDIAGKVRVDFKDPKALCSLSKTLLKKDFDLDVDIPLTSLIPTIPLRVNYILFIEDILNLAKIERNVRGLDIGTGASCIYPLIAAKRLGWKMTGTEINDESINYAEKNIEANDLRNLINVVKVKEDTVLNEVLERDNNKHYHFCMCNPPFFGKLDEITEPRGRPNRPPPNNAFTGLAHELITEGGEVEFVGKIIEESRKWKNNIKVFTSMVGIKHNLAPLLAQLKNITDVNSIVTTEFYQGHTSRYGLAWTFDKDINLEKLGRSVIKVESERKNTPYVHKINECNISLEEVDVRLRAIFEELLFNYTELQKNISNRRSYIITAQLDTWSNYRRRHRMLMHQDKKKYLAVTERLSTIDNVNNSNIAGTSKRKNEDEADTNNLKRFKENYEKFKSVIFVECAVSLRKMHSEVSIELLYMNGKGGRGSTHDILQYIKNHLKLK